MHTAKSQSKILVFFFVIVFPHFMLFCMMEDNVSKYDRFIPIAVLLYRYKNRSIDTANRIVPSTTKIDYYNFDGRELKLTSPTIKLCLV